MLVVTNAFSINMLSGSTSYRFSQVSLEDAREMLSEGSFDSAVGHPDTAAIFSALLGQHVRCNRVSVSDPTRLLVGQYTGPRLPEGASQLPEGASIQWWVVSLIDWDEVANFYEGRI